MLREQDVVLQGVDEELSFVQKSTRQLMDAVLAHGDGDVAKGAVGAFDAGALDVPFAPSDAAAGDVLPARDDDGRVRILEFGDLALAADVREVHENRLDGRAETEGRPRDFRMVADDVDAISAGKLIGRPTGGAD
jgi:methylaspartate mutase epsilon subunit